jgi:hypothetical protein
MGQPIRPRLSGLVKEGFVIFLGYDGLRAANRLDLLESDELRAMLTSYYEVGQPFVKAYHEIAYERREGLLMALAPHIAYRTYPPEPTRLGLRGT